MRRVVPVLKELRSKTDVLLSIDTTKSKVAREALIAGADVINDISGGLFDKEMPRVAAGEGSGYVCGHVRGTNIDEVHASESAQDDVRKIFDELCQRIATMPDSLQGFIVADPCLGFGKQTQSNIDLIANGRDII